MRICFCYRLQSAPFPQSHIPITDAMLPLAGLSLVGKSVVAKFDGGLL